MKCLVADAWWYEGTLQTTLGPVIEISMPHHQVASLLIAILSNPWMQEALLQALHSVKDGQLPLAGGQLWNTFLLPGRRAGTHLDLKASSVQKAVEAAAGEPGDPGLSCLPDSAVISIDIKGS